MDTKTQERAMEIGAELTELGIQIGDTYGYEYLGGFLVSQLARTLVLLPTEEFRLTISIMESLQQKTAIIDSHRTH